VRRLLRSVQTAGDGGKDWRRAGGRGLRGAMRGRACAGRRRWRRTQTLRFGVVCMAETAFFRVCTGYMVVESRRVEVYLRQRTPGVGWVGIFLWAVPKAWVGLG
jgi:hypothetical protein